MGPVFVLPGLAATSRFSLFSLGLVGLRVEFFEFLPSLPSELNEGKKKRRRLETTYHLLNMSVKDGETEYKL